MSLLSLKPTFSIVIPVYNRKDEIVRCLQSVINQTYDQGHYEIIVVDDGSTDRTAEVVQLFVEKYPELIKLHIFEENRGRIAARNVGMALANKEWICWLDSDDEYVSTYLEMMSNAINEHPNFSIFNFGAIVYDEQAVCSRLRDTFLPDVRKDGGGHDNFKSGGIGTGSFIFKAELGKKIGPLPESRSPYGDAGSLPALATEKWPFLAEIYGQNEKGAWLPFGNPWGDDWLMFFLLTRENLSKPLTVHPYIQHLRK